MKNQSTQPHDLNRPLRAGENCAPAPAYVAGKPTGDKLKDAPDGALTKEHHANGVFDDDIRRELKGYKIDNKLTNAQIAKQLNVGPTAVSAYLNKDLRGSWQLLQARAKDLIENAKKRAKETRLPLQDTPTTATFTGVVELIRKTNDFALVHGKAGVGKSCAIALYAQRYPTTVPIFAAVWKQDVSGVINALMEETGWNAWDAKTPRGIWLEQRYRNTNRLIIVDNAQRLTRQALAWLFDFHDATGCPVVLVGNPEVLEKIRGNDQFFSRIGICEEIKLESVEAIEEFTKALLGKMAPELVPVIGSEASERLATDGHARSLVKQIKLTQELLATEQFKNDPRKAFAAAKQKLISGKGAK